MLTSGRGGDIRDLGTSVKGMLVCQPPLRTPVCLPVPLWADSLIFLGQVPGKCLRTDRSQDAGIVTLVAKLGTQDTQPLYVTGGNE